MFTFSGFVFGFLNIAILNYGFVFMTYFFPCVVFSYVMYCVYTIYILEWEFIKYLSVSLYIVVNKYICYFREAFFKDILKIFKIKKYRSMAMLYLYKYYLNLGSIGLRGWVALGEYVGAALSILNCFFHHIQTNISKWWIYWNHPSF